MQIDKIKRTSIGADKSAWWIFQCPHEKGNVHYRVPAPPGQENMEAEGNQFQEQSSEPRRVQQQPQPPLRCANCDIDILWPPTVVQGKTFCCTGCAAGGPCNCDYSQYRSANISGVIHYLN
jgi:hypothetical protein